MYVGNLGWDFWATSPLLPRLFRGTGLSVNIHQNVVARPLSATVATP